MIVTETCDTIADGLATRHPLEANVHAIRQLVDEVRLVSERDYSMLSAFFYWTSMSWPKPPARHQPRHSFKIRRLTGAECRAIDDWREYPARGYSPRGDLTGRQLPAPLSRRPFVRRA